MSLFEKTSMNILGLKLLRFYRLQCEQMSDFLQEHYFHRSVSNVVNIACRAGNSILHAES